MPAERPREYYRDDLLGFHGAQLAKGSLLGALQHFLEAPAGALMVVRGDKRERWLPARRRTCGAWIWSGARSRWTGRRISELVRIEVVTLFPALIEDALRYGVLGRARGDAGC